MLQNGVSPDAIIRSVHDKFNCIAVKFDRIQHSIFILQSLCFNALHKCHFENEKIICNIVRISEVCGQNGDRVSEKDKSCHK